jgi:chromosome segregation ATPase
LFSAMALVGGVIGGASYQAVMEQVYATAGQLKDVNTCIGNFDLRLHEAERIASKRSITIQQLVLEVADLKKWRGETDTGIEELSRRIGGGITSLQDDCRALSQRITAVEKQSDVLQSLAMAARDAAQAVDLKLSGFTEQLAALKEKAAALVKPATARIYCPCPYRRRCK